ncbi:MAG: ribosome small subunit-dependent GTPase A [Acutalibacteraceae bacterium]|nr:ribosome small subunit-dependent GTPase A [Acutalibacteraceae bacterium]
MNKGIIIKAIAGFYYVDSGDDVIECKARGKFRNKALSPLVGDRVEISVDNGKGAIENISERKNHLIRPPIANLDVLFIIASTANPAPNTFVIDKLTAYAEFVGVTPIIVTNKSDLASAQDLTEIYKNAGYKVIKASGLSGDGVDEIKSEIEGKICAFTGNSGVGKSSILNHIMPELSLQTADISHKLGRGRHTTRHTELYRCGSGYIADTPGFSNFELQDELFIHKDELQDCFPEFEEFLGGCKFTSCAHIGEKGCGVVEAVNEGKIHKSRFENYVRMYKEAAEIPDWQLKKDRK